MFAGINVSVFETKPCWRGLIFGVSLGLVSCLGTWIMFAGYLFLRNSPNKSLANINELIVLCILTLLYGYYGLDRSYEHHANHHDRKYRYWVATHPHDEEVHWDLSKWTQGNIPWFLDNAKWYVSTLLNHSILSSCTVGLHNLFHLPSLTGSYWFYTCDM